MHKHFIWFTTRNLLYAWYLLRALIECFFRPHFFCLYRHCFLFNDKKILNGIRKTNVCISCYDNKQLEETGLLQNKLLNKTSSLFRMGKKYSLFILTFVIKISVITFDAKLIDHSVCVCVCTRGCENENLMELR